MKFSLINILIIFSLFFLSTLSVKRVSVERGSAKRVSAQKASVEKVSLEQVSEEQAPEEKGTAEHKSGLREIEEKDLTNFPFENKVIYDPPEVKTLTLGQQYTLESEREAIEDLIRRKLGVFKLRGTLDDLKTIQRLVDNRLIRSDDVKKWQAVGIIFGDVLANELDMHWVGYTDHLGSSRALQRKKTLNFIFPITIFSKRIQFGQAIDVHQIFLDIKAKADNYSD